MLFLKGGRLYDLLAVRIEGSVSFEQDGFVFGENLSQVDFGFFAGDEKSD